MVIVISMCALLALALVLTSLTACNGAGAGNTEDPNSSISSEVVSSPSNSPLYLYTKKCIFRLGSLVATSLKSITNSNLDSSNIAFPEYNKIRDNRLRECNYGEYDGQDKKLVVYEEHIENPFPNGESLKDVERRMYSFINYLKENFYDKKIGIVAHRAPQLALEVLTKKISWEEAIENDWRKTKAWKPGWKYII